MRHRAVQEQRSDMQRILSLNGNWGSHMRTGPPIAAPWEFTTLNPAPARRLMTAEVPEPVPPGRLKSTGCSTIRISA